MTPEEREQLEGDFVRDRIIQLELEPIRGNFDSAHLKQINKFLFQDFPGAGLTHVTPGEFRPPVPADQDWIKQRALSTANASYVVAYSRMDDAALKRMDDVLKGAKPVALSKLPQDVFAGRVAKLYAELDYLHPFSDGNSRTLRTFTRQFAREAGYELDWTRLGQSPQGRDALYVARDLSVNRIAKPHLQDFATVRNVEHTELILAGNRDIEKLLPGLIRPTRALVFEKVMDKQIQVADALHAHPELRSAFETVRDASAYFASKTSDLDSQQAGFKQAVARVQQSLNVGETRFAHGRDVQVQVREQGGATRTAEKDRER